MKRLRADSPLIKKIIIVWVVFVSLHFFWSQYRYLSNFVARQAYTTGYTDAAAQLIQQVSKCQPVPINLGQQSVSVIAMDCLQELGSPAEDIE